MTAPYFKQSLSSIQDKLNHLTLKVVTLHSLGTFFSNDPELSFPGCVIVDYTDACLALIEEIELSVSSVSVSPFDGR